MKPIATILLALALGLATPGLASAAAGEASPAAGSAVAPTKQSIGPSFLAARGAASALPLPAVSVNLNLPNAKGVGSAAAAVGSAAGISSAAGAGSVAAAAGVLATSLGQAAQGVAWASVLVWLVPLVLVVVLAVAFVWWRSRRKKAAAPPAAVAAPAQAPAVPSDVLSKAWGRFIADLPLDYRRSLANFEHYLVLGASASGKTHLVDAYTDWRRQSKQVSVSRPHDPDLPVYAPSGAIVVELPSRFLGELSASGRRALERLFRAAYRRRAPTVVVAIDAAWLQASAPGAIAELAEGVRARVNLVTAARGGRPVEVRVALTRLDAIEGYTEFARFCREQGLETRGAISASEGALPPSEQVAAWLASLQEHLSRALVRLPSSDFLRVVAFLQRAPALASPLGTFVSTLFAHEALSKAPRPGGIYLTSEPAGASNPFEPPFERAPLVDPRRPHQLGAAALAAAAIAYLAFAYVEQRARYDRAEEAFAAYSPASVGGDDEERRREAVVAFLRRDAGFFGQLRYFSSTKKAMRKAFAERVRDGFLAPRLRHVALHGSATTAALAMPVRRSVYYLALIHSDKSDPLGLLHAPGRLEIAATMTELPVDFLRDYLESVDERRGEPVDFDIARGEEGAIEEGPLLARFLDEFTDAIEHPEAVTFGHLQGIRARAGRLDALLRRVANDRETEALLGTVGPADAAVRAGGASAALPSGLLGLEPSYEPRFADYLRFARDYKVDEQARALGEVVSLVLARHEAGDRDAASLVALVESLEGLVEVEAIPGSLTTISVAGRKIIIDLDRWRDALRSVDVRERLDNFLDTAGASTAIFFGPDGPSIAPRAGRPGATKGRLSLAPRHTRQAYDEHVRRPVLRLHEVLGKSGLSEEQRRPTHNFIREAVRDYAVTNAAQARSLVQGFQADAQSTEELRALIAQMAKPEGSAFDDLLKVVDENTRLGCESVMLETACEAMGEFAGWHAIVGADGGAPEIVKYRAILTQLLADLAPAEGAAAPAAGPETLERSLSPAGRLALAEIKGDKGSYSRLVSDWASALDLPDYQRRVFTAPVVALSRLGSDEISRALDRAFRAEMLPDLRRLSELFPFRADAQDDAPAAEVEAVFHPQKGRFFDAFRRHFEPVFDFGDGGPFALKRTAAGKVRLPAHLAETVNAAAALAARLWDEKGTPLPTPVRVRPLPFERGRDPKLAPALAHLNAGTSALVYFNQRPATSTLRLDWAAGYASQAGLELADIANGERSFADPFVAETSPWSFLRLLRLAKAETSRLEPGAQTYTFLFKIGDAGLELPVRFVVFDDPMGAFTIGNLVRSKVAAAPKRAGR